MNNLYSVDSYVLIIKIFQALFSTTAFPPYSLKSIVALDRDPLYPYLFIIILECNKNIQGIVVDEEEMKLGLFADDLAAFFKE